MSPRFRRLVLASTVAVVAPFITPERAAAQSELTFSASPYLWVAGISGSVNTPYQRLPDKNVDVSFGDTLSNLSGFAFMGAAEMRYGRFGLVADFLTLNIESDISTAGGLFSGGTGRVTTTMATVLGMIRVLENDTHTLDIGGGVRPWWLSTRISLDAGALPGRSLKSSINWTDPVFAVRYSARFNESWGATIYGDIGGFDAGSELTWQALATVDYRFRDWITLRAGYRHLQIEQNARGTDVGIGLSGPILGATFRF